MHMYYDPSCFLKSSSTVLVCGCWVAGVAIVRMPHSKVARWSTRRAITFAKKLSSTNDCRSLYRELYREIPIYRELYRVYREIPIISHRYTYISLLFDNTRFVISSRSTRNVRVVFPWLFRKVARRSMRNALVHGQQYIGNIGNFPDITIYREYIGNFPDITIYREYIGNFPDIFNLDYYS